MGDSNRTDTRFLGVVVGGLTGLVLMAYFGPVFGAVVGSVLGGLFGFYHQRVEAWREPDEYPRWQRPPSKASEAIGTVAVVLLILTMLVVYFVNA